MTGENNYFGSSPLPRRLEILVSPSSYLQARLQNCCDPWLGVRERKCVCGGNLPGAVAMSSNDSVLGVLLVAMVAQTLPRRPDGMAGGGEWMGACIADKVAMSRLCPSDHSLPPSSYSHLAICPSTCCSTLASYPCTLKDPPTLHLPGADLGGFQQRQ